MNPWAASVVPLAVGAVGLLGTWLALGGQMSISASEAARVAVTTEPLRVATSAALEARPPGYELVLALWARVLGSNEIPLRALSLVWTVVTLIATAGVARSVVGPWGAALAPLLLAASPLVITNSLALSPYAQATALSAAATWLFVARSERKRTWAAYALLGAAALWTHPAAAAVLLSHGAQAVASRASPRRVVAWGAATALAFIPLLVWGAAALIASPSQPTADLLEILMDDALPLWAVPPIAIVALVAVGIVRSPPPQEGLLARAALPLVSFGWLWVFDLVLPQVDGHVLMLAVPMLAAALAEGLVWVGRAMVGAIPAERQATRAWGRLGQAGLPLLAVALLLGAGWVEVARAQAGRPGYRELVAHVRREARERDLIVMAVPGQFRALEYYNRGRLPVIELPFAPAFLETIGETVLSSLLGVARGMWVVTTDGPHDPEGRLPSWLAGRLYSVDDYRYGSVQLRLYQSEPDMRSGQGRSVFGGVVELPEAAVPAATVGRDFPVAVRLHWRAREPISSRLVVAVELVGDGGRVHVRREGEPAAGTRPTTTWEVGETIVDRVALSIPDTLPTGAYTVRAFLYETGTRARLKLADGREMLDIGMVRIGPATRTVAS